MRVTCPNCGKAHEVEIGPEDKATRTRCDDCGTAFLVRVSARTRGSGERGPYNWYVRKADSTLLSFPGDPQLHEAIRKGLVELQDEISADGTTWNRISSLPILRAFMERWQGDAELESPTADQPPGESTSSTEAPETHAKPARSSAPEKKKKPKRRVVPSDIAALPTQVMDTRQMKDAMERSREAGDAHLSHADTRELDETDSEQIPEHLVGGHVESTVQTEPFEKPAKPPEPSKDRRNMDWGEEWADELTQTTKQFENEMTGFVSYARRTQWIVGGIILVVLLIGGAYFVVDWMNSPVETETGDVEEQTEKQEHAPTETTEVQDVVASSDTVAEMPPVPSSDVVETRDLADVVPDIEAPQADVVDVQELSDTDLTQELMDQDLETQHQDVVRDTEMALPGATAGTEESDAVEDTLETTPDMGTPEPHKVETPPAEKPREAKRPKKREPKPEREEPEAKNSSEPRGFDGYKLAGRKAFLRGRYSEARSLYQKALSIKPDNAEIVNKIAECYRKSGNCNKAIEQYQQAISLTGFYSSYIGMARCYKGRGEKDKAVKILKKGLDRHPRNRYIQALLDQYGG